MHWFIKKHNVIFPSTASSRCLQPSSLSVSPRHVPIMLCGSCSQIHAHRYWFFSFSATLYLCGWAEAATGCEERSCCCCCCRGFSFISFICYLSAAHSVEVCMCVFVPSVRRSVRTNTRFSTGHLTHFSVWITILQPIMGRQSGAGKRLSIQPVTRHSPNPACRQRGTLSNPLSASPSFFSLYISTTEGPVKPLPTPPPSPQLKVVLRQWLRCLHSMLRKGQNRQRASCKAAPNKRHSLYGSSLPLDTTSVYIWGVITSRSALHTNVYLHIYCSFDAPRPRIWHITSL